MYAYITYGCTGVRRPPRDSGQTRFTVSCNECYLTMQQCAPHQQIFKAGLSTGPDMQPAAEALTASHSCVCASCSFIRRSVQGRAIVAVVVGNASEALTYNTTKPPTRKVLYSAVLPKPSFTVRVRAGAGSACAQKFTCI